MIIKEALKHFDKVYHIRSKYFNWAFSVSLFASEINPADL